MKFQKIHLAYEDKRLDLKMYQMKRAILMLIFLQIGLISCGQTNTKNNKASSIVHSCIQKKEAEKILGQPAILTESSTENKDSVIKLRCTYPANESIGKRRGHLYCMLEDYSGELLAKNAYAEILTRNQDMPNLKKINIGNEALRHTDNDNFDLIAIRKDNKIIRLKENKITSLTLAANLKIVAEKLTALL